MRTLTSTLTTAQKSAARAPYVRVRIIPRPAGVGRLDWSRLYTGAEGETSHGLAQTGNGTLIRVRVNGTDPQYNRVATPGAGSDYATWTSFTGGLSVISICANAANAWAIGANSSGEVYANSSSDHGATWSGWSLIAAAGTAPSVIASAIKSNGEVLAIYDRGATLYRIKRSGGSWGSQTAWTNTVASITGVAVSYQGDWNTIITGTETTTTDPMAWSCIFGDGYSYSVNTWGPLKEISRASSGSNVSFKRPSLALPDAFRTTWVEKYTGTQSYTRMFFTHSPPTAEFGDNLWREPVPMNITGLEEGLAIAWGAGANAWLSYPAGVWQGPLVTGTGLDVTADLLRVHLQDRPFAGHALVHLRNDNGQYASPGSGALANLKRGSQLTIDPGYTTTAGNEVSAGPTYWIEALGYDATPARAELIISATSGWGLLEAWTARRQFSWAAGSKSVYNLLKWVFARAGFDFAGTGPGASSACTSLTPAFTIQPGTSGLAAAQALLAKVPDLVLFQGASAGIFNPTSSQASAYSYGGTHVILEATYRTNSHDPNHAQVFGTGVFNEDMTWSELELLYARTRQVHDAGLTAAADALARAQAILRQAAIHSSADRITVPANCGQELYDVVDVTDPRANLSAAKRRVLALDLDYHPARGTYRHTLALGQQ